MSQVMKQKRDGIRFVDISVNRWSLERQSLVFSPAMKNHQWSKLQKTCIIMIETNNCIYIIIVSQFADLLA